MFGININTKIHKMKWNVVYSDLSIVGIPHINRTAQTDGQDVL